MLSLENMIVMRNRLNGGVGASHPLYTPKVDTLVTWSLMMR